MGDRILDIRKVPRSNEAEVRELTPGRFARPGVQVSWHARPLEVVDSDAVARANHLKARGRVPFSALRLGKNDQNCESVAWWIATGKAISEQATTVKVGMAVISFAALGVLLTSADDE